MNNLKIPEIEFRYSWIYDEQYRSDIKIIRELKKLNMKYPSYKTISNYMKKIESSWKHKRELILKELSNISGLDWKDDKIICYVVGYGIPFSDPLTIPVYKNDIDYGIYVLTHELIHQLFIQVGNMEKSKKSWSYIWNKYKEQSVTTKIHIPLHAIQSYLYRKNFGEKLIKKDKMRMKKRIDYSNSWKIVEMEGCENIIKEFRRRIKNE